MAPWNKDGLEDDHDRAWWVRCAREALSAGIPEDQIAPFLEYLEEFPLGVHNRRAAEAVEPDNQPALSQELLLGFTRQHFVESRIEMFGI